MSKEKEQKQEDSLGSQNNAGLPLFRLFQSKQKSEEEKKVVPPTTSKPKSGPSMTLNQTDINDVTWLNERIQDISQALNSRMAVDISRLYTILSSPSVYNGLKFSLPKVGPMTTNDGFFANIDVSKIKDFETAMNTIENELQIVLEGTKNPSLVRLQDKTTEGKRLIAALDVLQRAFITHRNACQAKRTRAEQVQQTREEKIGVQPPMPPPPVVGQPTTKTVAPPAPPANTAQAGDNQEALIAENESLLHFVFDHVNGFESFLQTTNPTQYQKWRTFRREFETREVDSSWTRRLLNELPSISLTLQSIVEARTKLQTAHKVLEQSRQHMDLGREELQKKLDEALAEQTRLSSVVTRLDQQRKEAESKVRSLEQQVTLEQGNQETLTTRIREALSKVDKLQKDRDEAFDTVRQFDAKIEELKQEIAVERGLNAEVQQSVAEAQSQLKKMSERLEAESRKRQDLATELQAAEKLHQTMIRQSAEKLLHADKEITALTHQVEELKAALATEKEQRQTLEVKLPLSRTSRQSYFQTQPDKETT